jgi:glycosyltransferase involved in cell wall biosynthesis
MTSVPKATIAYLTAGAAGMYCGSCMRDNALAAALHRMGIDIHLIPTYTPIRTDEENVSDRAVFFGGINVYLQQKSALFRLIPRAVDRLLDLPWIIGWATSHGIQTTPRQLGELTISMLDGTHGHQRKEVLRLCDWLDHQVHPSLINFTNLLIAGCAPAIKHRLRVPLLATLQGDDIFLEGLAEPYRSRAIEKVRQLAQQFDGFLVFSRFYADAMADYFSLPSDRIHVVPLGIEIRDFVEWPEPPADRRPTIGYLARLAPEKGLHVLTEAYLQLRQRHAELRPRLLIAGWLGPEHRAYAEAEFQRLRQAGVDDQDFQYWGSVDRRQKLDFLRQIDVLSVPTVYREPKGLFVLEAMAAGVPVVQPDHGAFPELIEATGAGRLFPAGDSGALADELGRMLCHLPAARAMGTAGRQFVLNQLSADVAAQNTWQVYQQYLPSAAGKLAPQSL